MRVISGQFKGKKLFAPEDNRVRPTTDRIKETLFNILSSKGLCGDITALDLFGGSGALGIEAMSRGARKTVFIDKDYRSVSLIKTNLAHVGASAADYEIHNVDFAFALKKLKDKRFDVIFADPPYAAGLESAIAETVCKFNVLSKHGVLVIEHSADVDFVCEDYDEDKRVCGNTVLSFLSLKNATYEEEVKHNE